jgi:hypothetical protein
MPATPETLAPVYDRLRAMMHARHDGLHVLADAPGDYQLETVDVNAQFRKKVWFGAVQQKKQYVSVHLIPVYENPALLDAVSDRLKKRMQGKSCFNFAAIDDALFAELDTLIACCKADFAGKFMTGG